MADRQPSKPKKPMANPPTMAGPGIPQKKASPKTSRNQVMEKTMSNGTRGGALGRTSQVNTIATRNQPA
jgi:hypothetical protein